MGLYDGSYDELRILPHKSETFYDLDMKPFTCTLCMSFWASVGYMIAVHGLKGILYSAIVAVTAELLDRKINML